MGDLSEWYYELRYVSSEPYSGTRKEVTSSRKLCGNRHHRAKLCTSRGPWYQYFLEWASQRTASSACHCSWTNFQGYDPRFCSCTGRPNSAYVVFFPRKWHFIITFKKYKQSSIRQDSWPAYFWRDKSQVTGVCNQTPPEDDWQYRLISHQ